MELFTNRAQFHQQHMCERSHDDASEKERRDSGGARTDLLLDQKWEQGLEGDLEDQTKQ